MTKSRSRPPSIPTIVTEIGSKAQIRALNLVRCSCEVTGELPPGERVEDLRFSLRGGADRHKKDPQTIICRFGMDLTALGPKPQGISVAKISCDYAVQYFFEDKEFAEALKTDELRMFAAFNTSIHVWPHVREFVQSMSFRMTIPPVTLPMFRPLQMIGTPDTWKATQAPTDRGT